MRHFSRLSLMAALGTALIAPAFAQGTNLGTNQAAAPASPGRQASASSRPASPPPRRRTSSASGGCWPN